RGHVGAVGRLLELDDRLAVRGRPAAVPERRARLLRLACELGNDRREHGRCPAIVLERGHRAANVPIDQVELVLQGFHPRPPPPKGIYSSRPRAISIASPSSARRNFSSLTFKRASIWRARSREIPYFSPISCSVAGASFSMRSSKIVRSRPDRVAPNC